VISASTVVQGILLGGLYAVVALGLPQSPLDDAFRAAVEDFQARERGA